MDAPFTKSPGTARGLGDEVVGDGSGSAAYGTASVGEQEQRGGKGSDNDAVSQPQSSISTLVPECAQGKPEVMLTSGGADEGCAELLGVSEQEHAADTKSWDDMVKDLRMALSGTEDLLPIARVSYTISTIFGQRYKVSVWNAITAGNVVKLILQKAGSALDPHDVLLIYDKAAISHSTTLQRIPDGAALNLVVMITGGMAPKKKQRQGEDEEDDDDDADDVMDATSKKVAISSIASTLSARLSVLRDEPAFAGDAVLAGIEAKLRNFVQQARADPDFGGDVFKTMMDGLTIKQMKSMVGISKNRNKKQISVSLLKLLMTADQEQCASKTKCIKFMNLALRDAMWLIYNSAFMGEKGRQADHSQYETQITDALTAAARAEGQASAQASAASTGRRGWFM